MLGAVQPSRAHEFVDTPVARVDEPLPSRAVARIGTRLVAKRSVDHWFRVVAAGRRSRPGSPRRARLRREAMKFLIQGVWVAHEAREHGIAVSRRTVRRSFRRQKRQTFRSERAYRRYLRPAWRTERDILYRVKLDLLSDRLMRHVKSQARSPAEEVLVVERFVEGFPRKWRARTACAHGYVTSDCSRAVSRLPG